MQCGAATRHSRRWAKFNGALPRLRARLDSTVTTSRAWQDDNERAGGQGKPLKTVGLLRGACITQLKLGDNESGLDFTGSSKVCDTGAMVWRRDCAEEF